MNTDNENSGSRNREKIKGLGHDIKEKEEMRKKKREISSALMQKRKQMRMSRKCFLADMVQLGNYFPSYPSCCFLVQDELLHLLSAKKTQA